jgi:Flp pilus assembly protein TadD
LWQTGRIEEAQAEFERAVGINPRSAEAHYMLGTVLKQRRDGAAIEEFTRAIELNPTLAEAHLSLGQLLQQMGQPDRAKTALAEHARLMQRKADGQASTFAVGVGREKLKQKDVHAAIAQFREAIRLAPDNPQAHYELAMALKQVGDLASSREHLAEAQRLAPWLGKDNSSRQP